MVRLFVFARDSRILFLRKINRTHRPFFRTNVIDFSIKKIHRAKTMLIDERYFTKKINNI